MDHVFAHVKSNTKRKVFKLISNHTLFTFDPNSLDCFVEYDPSHNLDEDSWFKITNFRSKPFCPDILKCNFDSKDYDNLEKEQFESISYVFSVQKRGFYFQKVSRGVFFKRKMIAFGEIVEIEEKTTRIAIKDEPDAIYLTNEDMLVFKKLTTISDIFKGIDILFKEATNDEVRKFLGSPFIALSPDYQVNSVSKLNRRRTTPALEALANMTETQKQQLVPYINEYYPAKLKLDQNNEKFVISNDDELKMLLYGVQERFYTTKFGGEKRVANSVLTIGKT